MKKVTYPESFKQYIEELAGFCAYVTQAREYELYFEYSAERHNVDSQNGIEDRMSIRVDSTYLYATIYIYPIILELFRKKNHHGIARSMLHELCHILTEPLSRSMMSDAAPSQQQPSRRDVERQTQRVCNALWHLLPKNWFLPEKIMEKEGGVAKKNKR